MPGRGNRGKGWENTIDVMHEVYRKAGSAYTQRNYPQMRAVGDRFVPVGEGPPDYTVIAGGFTFLIDAKECNETRWSFGLLKDHQARQFEAAEKAGAHAAILLRFTGRAAFAILWRDLKLLWLPWRRKQAAQASLTVDEAREIACWTGDGAKGEKPDYLTTLVVNVSNNKEKKVA